MIESRAPVGVNAASNGWSTRLYWQWILYNSVAFVVVLTAVAVLAWIGADLLHLELASSSKLAALLVATLGAVLFGGVLGSLQWLVIRERVPVPRKKWIVANVGPALLGWLFVITPAVITAQDSDTDASGAFLLAASQTLALGPLLGLSQANILRTYTRRWAWWIAANIISWLIVDAVFYLLSQWFDALDFTRHDGSVAQVYLMLIASTPLTGRMLLWVLAPSAVLSQEPAVVSQQPATT
jgi:putative Mn2+ efflux pump MntP